MVKNSLQTFLDQQRASHLYRERSIIDGPQGIELAIDGVQYLNFCSNDYLGHANHPKLREAFIQGVQQYGVGSGASHLISGHSRAHHQLEESLAEFVKRPRALLFSTGYMANLGVISALLGRDDQVFEDRLNHASLLDGAILSRAHLQRYRHGDAQDLNAKLATGKSCNKLVVSDGVFSMDGDLAPVSDLVQVAQAHNAWVMIDDAHGLGTIGKHGRGLLDQAGMGSQEVPILVGTLGKAFGTFGAFVAGDEVLIETLIQKARSYIYTTALPAAVAFATQVSLRLIDEESWRREKLQDNIRLWRDLAKQAGIPLTDSRTPIQPIILGDVERTTKVSAALRKQAILVTAIRPPTVPKGTARLRITLSADHSPEHIRHLVRILSQCGVAQRVKHG